MDARTQHILEEFVSPERIELLNQLDGLFLEVPVPRELWACLWLSDLEKLRKLVDDVINNTEKERVYLVSMIQNSDLVKHWTQRTRSRLDSAASTPRSLQAAVQPPMSVASSSGALETSEALSSPLLSAECKRKRDEQATIRSQREADLCRERDCKQCVITQADSPVEVTHIFPFAMRYLQSHEARKAWYNPWKVLRLFWSDERVDRWLQTIEPTTETMKNLLCLTPSVHKYHANAYFALKPVEMSEDETILTLQFHWLPCINNPSTMRISTKPDIPRIGDRRENDSKMIKIWNVETEKKICSGDQIVMKTIDKKRFPLPDPAILDMQWVLHALTAMSAGAEPLEELYENDDDYSHAGMIYDDYDNVSVLSLSEGTTVSSSSQQAENKVNTLEATMHDAVFS
ncbi:hypothetical protein EMCG_03949 [[Emmonsia] crescens]|uniref:HNH nuclease domain-containing protein n=1 Tax=[Emmonsia] crescens TaxID=73230 RepID=A0A0G2J814_9EURO|nr:hypothetical protein EMCG_03949 [Emmonsia crescens UAMH 3008]